MGLQVCLLDTCCPGSELYLGDLGPDPEGVQAGGRHLEVEAHHVLQGAHPVREKASALRVEAHHIRHLIRREERTRDIQTAQGRTMDGWIRKTRKRKSASHPMYLCVKHVCEIDSKLSQ